MMTDEEIVPLVQEFSRFNSQGLNRWQILIQQQGYILQRTYSLQSQGTFQQSFDTIRILIYANRAWISIDMASTKNNAVDL